MKETEEIIGNKSYFDVQFKEARERFLDLKEELRKIRDDMPKVARKEAEGVIARTQFIKPGEKAIVAIAFIGLLLTAFAGYGKQASMIDRFQHLEQIIEKKQVLENSDWMNNNKNTLTNTLNKLNEKIEKLGYRIQFMEDKNMRLIK
jgi:hypothetical protein